MNLNDIKRGDILTVTYCPINHWSYPRKHITLIAKGGYTENYSMFGKCYSIFAIALIDLKGELHFISGLVLDDMLKIGYGSTTSIRKATFEETLELIGKLKSNGIVYNRKSKMIKHIG